MYQYSSNYSDMIDEIKAKRELMINSALTLGYTSEQTIKYSQELDELINTYQRIIGQASKSNEEVKIALKQMIMVWPKILV